MATYLGRFLILAKLASEWSAANPVLMNGELGVADPGSALPVLKVGDGVRPWSALPQISGAGGGGASPDYIAGTTTTLAPGSFATVAIDNTVSPPTISFGIPRGDPGPANTLAIGTTTTGLPGSPASATISGVAPNQTLNLVIPQGPIGPQGIDGADGSPGPAGATGPANVLTIGTVTTAPAGGAADATITGTTPAQVLNLTIPTGAQGPQGPIGPAGPGGSSSLADPTALVGLAVVPGVSTFGMRADAAPALSLAISPPWTGQHSWTLPLIAAHGSPAVPSYSFTAAGGYGLYYAAGALGFAAGGVQAGYLSSNALTVNGNITATNGFVNATNNPGDSAYLAAQISGTEGLYFVANNSGDVLAGIPANSYGISTATGNPITVVLGSTVVARFGGSGGNGTGSLTTYGTATNYALNCVGYGTSANVGSTSGIRLVSSGSGRAVDIVFTDGAVWNSWIGAAGNGDLIFSVTGAGSFGMKLQIGATRTRTVNPLQALDGSASVTAFGFDAEPGNGMFRRVANTLSFAAAGVIAFEATASGLYAPSFNSSSSRAIKRETGAPSKVANILARLRPLLYRLLDGDDREQLGLVAEEVHEVCPQLSDGKTVAYDRLAILLLADWQASRGNSSTPRS
jgi:hypothetical protein